MNGFAHPEGGLDVGGVGRCLYVIIITDAVQTLFPITHSLGLGDFLFRGYCHPFETVVAADF